MEVFGEMLRKCLWGGLLVLLLIQFIPYGRDHPNPQVSAEPRWDSPKTRTLFFRACRDCHSNETVWPSYSFVAPISWIVAHDVEEGRSHFNVSEWGPESEHGEDAAEMVAEGEMPMWIYLPFHPEAQLSPEEKESLILGLRRTFEGAAGQHSKGLGHDGHDHHHHHH